MSVAADFVALLRHAPEEVGVLLGPPTEHEECCPIVFLRQRVQDADGWFGPSAHVEDQRDPGPARIPAYHLFVRNRDSRLPNYNIRCQDQGGRPREATG